MNIILENKYNWKRRTFDKDPISMEDSTCESMDIKKSQQSDSMDSSVLQSVEGNSYNLSIFSD